MQDFNPYAEQAASTGPVEDSSRRAAPSVLIPPLRQSRPWCYVLSITGLLSAAFVLLGMISMLLVLGWFVGRGGFRANVAPLLIVLLVYSPLCIALAIPSLLLWRFARRIARFLRRPDNQQLETALKAQRTFWRWSGLLVLALIGIYLVLAMLVFVAPMQ
ncbi:MAG: hypothetical protein RIC55_10325 [Pirellulaceae bacterium]